MVESKLTQMAQMLQTVAHNMDQLKQAAQKVAQLQQQVPPEPNVVCSIQMGIYTAALIVMKRALERQGSAIKRDEKVGHSTEGAQHGSVPWIAPESEKGFAAVNSTQMEAQVVVESNDDILATSVLWKSLLTMGSKLPVSVWEQQLEQAHVDPMLKEGWRATASVRLHKQWVAYTTLGFLCNCLKRQGVSAVQGAQMLKDEGFSIEDILIGLDATDLFGVEKVLLESADQDPKGDIDDLISEHSWLLLGLYTQQVEEGWSARAYMYRQSDKLMGSLIGCIKSHIGQWSADGLIGKEPSTLRLLQIRYVESFLDIFTKRAKSHLGNQLGKALWQEQVCAIRDTCWVLDKGICERFEKVDA